MPLVTLRQRPVDCILVSVDPGLRFTGESDEYRRERNRLLESEMARTTATTRPRRPTGTRLDVFVRDGQTLRHAWATELMAAPWEEAMEPRHVDAIWPIWHVLDMTPGGRGTDPDFPSLGYTDACRRERTWPFVSEQRGT